MYAVGLIAAWAVLFVGAHFVLSWKALRSRLIGRFNEAIFRAIYSGLALVTFIGMAVAFARHKHAGLMLWDLRSIGPIRWLVWIAMLASLMLLAAGLANPSPAALATEMARGKPQVLTPPTGALKITRHPTFVAFGVFGLAHMLVNGWLGDLIFFGSFPVLGILGAIHQDRRKLAEIGASYRGFMNETSITPGLALLRGRQHWMAADTQWRALLIGLILAVIIVAVHPFIFGGHPVG